MRGMGRRLFTPAKGASQHARNDSRGEPRDWGETQRRKTAEPQLDPEPDTVASRRARRGAGDQRDLHSEQDDET